LTFDDKLLAMKWKRDSQEGARNTPLADGTANNQNVNAPIFNVNIVQPSLQPPQPPALSKIEEEARPNIRFIGANPVSLQERLLGGGLVEEGSRQNALIIRFANEARPDAQNLSARAKAVLIYRYGQNEINVAGSWLNESSDVSDFQPDSRRHKLIAGIVIDGELAAITGEKVNIHRRIWYLSDKHSLKGFQDGSPFVQLTDVWTMRVLYQGEFEISVKPLRIIPRQTA
jgi:hypothetical protein